MGERALRPVLGGATPRAGSRDVGGGAGRQPDDRHGGVRAAARGTDGRLVRGARNGAIRAPGGTAGRRDDVRRGTAVDLSRVERAARGLQPAPAAAARRRRHPRVLPAAAHGRPTRRVEPYTDLPDSRTRGRVAGLSIHRATDLHVRAVGAAPRGRLLVTGGAAGSSSPSSAPGSGSQKLAISPTRYTENPTAAATIAIFAGAAARSGVTASDAVNQANEVPIMRPPMFAANPSPVPRRCTGYTRGK